MSDKWYVVHVNTGSEDTVRKYILNQMEMDKCTDLIKDILVPTETIEEQVKGGKKKRSELEKQKERFINGAVKYGKSKDLSLIHI